MALNFPFNGLHSEDNKGKAVTFDYGMFIKRILVTGANGQLGNEMRLLASEHREFDFDFTDIQELDLTDENAVIEYCKKTMPSYIINCAAYTAVEKAEDNEDICYKINRDAVGNLAKAAKEVDAKILHISTDYVFDGSNTVPYVETDPVCPVSVYGKSKLAGEEILQSICTDSVILRTAWLYSPFGGNFVKTMLRLGKEKPSINVVSDQYGSPTYAGDLASALMKIISESEKGNFKPGIYNFTDEGTCSWYEFTLSIHKLAGISGCKVLPVKTDEYPSRVKRPAYSVLNKNKIKTVYGIEIPNWEASLAICISKLND